MKILIKDEQFRARNKERAVVGVVRIIIYREGIGKYWKKTPWKG